MTKQIRLNIFVPDLRTPDGKPTCAVDVTNQEGRCPYMASRLYGQVPTCWLFSADLGTYGPDDTGYTEPCDECIHLRENT